MNEQQDLGPLEPILSDPQVMEIMINGYQNVYVEKHGHIEQLPSGFRDDDHLMEIINQIAEAMGRTVDESHPILDVRLADDSRVHVVIPPIAADGPTMVIRKMYRRQLTINDLIGFGSLNQELADFLRACVVAHLNILVSGGTGSGKTTVLNTLTHFIPEDERIITVETQIELQLRHKHVVRLEGRPANSEGRGEISLRDLLTSAMKMRPDRIITSEVDSAAIMLLFQAMNTGYDGTLFSIHAISPRDALSRMEVMATAANPAMPLLVIRDQMAKAIDLIVQQERMSDGHRRIVKITEVAWLVGDTPELNDIFEFVPTGLEDGAIIGRFAPTGYVPTFLELFGEDDQRRFSPEYFSGAGR